MPNKTGHGSNIYAIGAQGARTEANVVRGRGRVKPTFVFDNADLLGLEAIGERQPRKSGAAKAGDAQRRAQQKRASLTALLGVIQVQLQEYRALADDDDEDGQGHQDDLDACDLIQRLWMAYPSLADASLAFIRLVGVQWRSSASVRPIGVQAIVQGALEAQTTMLEEGGASKVIIASYLARLADEAMHCAYFATLATDKDGQRVEWTPFRPGLLDWMATHEVRRVEVYKGAQPSRDGLLGVRTQLLADICNERDLGATLSVAR